jgi:hypothetical protein|tara:strand:- start:988 stop:1257 length:270 start_codon:yes stop_codon:yes gene_type:complete
MTKDMFSNDILIMYLEEDLDRGYRIDCKMRTKQNLAWLKRDEFRKVYEELLEAHLKGMPELPLELAMASVDQILEGNIRFNPDELNRGK